MQASRAVSTPGMSEPDVFPVISIVTPCLNAGLYIEATVQSVLSQDYPHIEYLVMDGGSTDDTLEILKRYEGQLRWISRKDRGTADAINKGFERCEGGLFTYLNADDVLLPGALQAAVSALESQPGVHGVYGNAWWIDQSGAKIRPYPIKDFDPKLLGSECFICQPASFVRSEAFRNLGGLDPTLGLTFDYEFWMRYSRLYTLKKIEEPLACSRMHADNKSLGRKKEVFEETFRVLHQHYGYVPFSWVYSYLCFVADGRDQFFEPIKPSLARYAESLPRGLALNRGAMGRYLAEWSGVMSWRGLQRRLLSPP
jgi:glycosyltransferase involved in cell wall biosynthesis